MNDVWKGKIKKVRSDGIKDAQYKHLKKRCRIGIDAPISEFDEEVEKQVNLICDKNVGWVIDEASKGKQSLRLRRSAKTKEDMTVDGHRIVLEIGLTLAPPLITLSTYGHDVPLKVLERTDNVTVSLFTIESAIHLVECTSLCLGQQILKNESGCFVVNVSGSKVLSVSSAQSETENRLISLSCSMITCHGKTSCQNCLYAYKLFRNRKYKRKVGDCSDTPNKKCNVRFLERSGMEEKMMSERKRRQCEIKKEQRRRNESIEFVGDDDSDLVTICKSIPANTTMPPEMKLLWKEQMKQLSSKSPKGYRWDPRFD